MKLKNWWQIKKPWLRGGIIGLFVCAFLFVFYIFLYFPLAEKIYGERNSPDSLLTVPFATGHMFPFLSGFIVPHGFLCEFSETICTGWQAENTGSGEPWRLESGEYGYCMNKTKVPTTACADFSEKVGFFGMTVLLFLVYFTAGALVGSFIQRRRRS